MVPAQSRHSRYLAALHRLVAVVDDPSPKSHGQSAGVWPTPDIHDRGCMALYTRRLLQSGTINLPDRPLPRVTAMTERVPQALAEKYAAITNLIGAFSAQHLNDEYLQMSCRLVATLARKRPSPLLNGKENVWAAAAVLAVGRVNFLDDPSQTPYCRTSTICEFFGVAVSTGQNKSREIRNLLKMGPASPDWTLPSRLADNPLVWMLIVNGLTIDIRKAPIDLQRAAFQQGLIPYVPGDRNQSTA